MIKKICYLFCLVILLDISQQSTLDFSYLVTFQGKANFTVMFIPHQYGDKKYQCSFRGMGSFIEYGIYTPNENSMNENSMNENSMNGNYSRYSVNFDNFTSIKSGVSRRIDVTFTTTLKGFCAIGIWEPEEIFVQFLSTPLIRGDGVETERSCYSSEPQKNTYIYEEAKFIQNSDSINFIRNFCLTL